MACSPPLFQSKLWTLPLVSLAYTQLQKRLQMRRKGALEEEQKDSGSEYHGDEDDIPLGPQSNVSLLDQHQHLKEKAEGGAETLGLINGWGGGSRKA